MVPQEVWGELMVEPMVGRCERLAYWPENAVDDASASKVERAPVEALILVSFGVLL